MKFDRKHGKEDRTEGQEGGKVEVASLEREKKNADEYWEAENFCLMDSFEKRRIKYYAVS